MKLKSHQRELGSSLPIMGGGGFYEILEKVTFIGKIFKINYRYLSFLYLEMKSLTNKVLHTLIR